MTEIIRRISIVGRVQGVGFRAWVAKEADAHNLAGWVRNRADGSVEAVFAGPEPIVTAMIEACHRGPSAARVTSVEVGAAPELPAARPGGDRFAILASA